jgi:hypothetical protein
MADTGGAQVRPWPSGEGHWDTGTLQVDNVPRGRSWQSMTLLETGQPEVSMH